MYAPTLTLFSLFKSSHLWREGQSGVSGYKYFFSFLQLIFTHRLERGKQKVGEWKKDVYRANYITEKCGNYLTS